MPRWVERNIKVDGDLKGRNGYSMLKRIDISLCDNRELPVEVDCYSSRPGRNLGSARLLMTPEDAWKLVIGLKGALEEYQED